MRTLAYLSSLWVTIQAYSEYAADVETVEFDKWTVDPSSPSPTETGKFWRSIVLLFLFTCLTEFMLDDSISTDPFLIKPILARLVLVTHVKIMEFVLQSIMACRLGILIGPEMEISLATVLSLLKEINAKDGVNS